MGGEVASKLRGGGAHDAWIEFTQRRVGEELYDAAKDPGCRHNLADNPEYESKLEEMRETLGQILAETADHELENFQRAPSGLEARQ